MIQKTLFYSSLACSHRSSELEDRLGLGPPHATTLASTSQSGCTIKQIWKSMRYSLISGWECILACCALHLVEAGEHTAQPERAKAAMVIQST